jgi:lipid-binding SYLF domain-containing protein
MTAITLLAAGAPAAFADDTMEAQRLVEEARLTFESLIADSVMGGDIRHLVRRARGVFISPQILRGAFIVGASGGNGVLLARHEGSGGWSGPAFYTIGEGSFGFQAGAQTSEVIIVALTDRGVTALLGTSAKLGVDVGVALGPIGAGAAAATANLSADLVSFSRRKGLFAGLSLDGAAVVTRDALNRAYYGTEVTPVDILINRSVTNPHSAGLIEAVGKVDVGK